MVALRKDVKVGFVVAGILIAVLGVYLGLSAIAGRTPAGANTTLADASSSPRPATSDAGKPAAKSTDVAGGGGAAAANSSSPLVAPKPAGGGSDDVWSNALNYGALPASVTVTPSLANPAREPAAKPGEVIDALRNPPRAPTANSQSASATDPSGSIVGGTVTPKLVRNDLTPPATRPAVAGSGDTHVVKAGETFSSIAAEHYGSATLFKLIVDANPGIEPAKLKPGVTLKLPPHEKSTKPTSAAAASDAKVDPAKQYVVKAGDSLEAIATRLYGDRDKATAIYDANKALIGTDPAKIKVGQTLTLPTPPTKK